MHLWTEYEGRTVAEHYTLGKLLRSEGRNGFFATADREGNPAVIRLTEAHFDEAEQLSRWRHVSEVHQGNLIEIEQVGQTTFEGVALTYALMEPEDANLGDVLKERPLTAAETTQVAKAVVLALRALHENNLVHGFVEPANVMAVGETVKLRSDCVRECAADALTTAEDCAELRRKDVQDFGRLLLRCLTLETEWSQAHTNLPAPFGRVIPKAMDGSWTLEQVGQGLDPSLWTPEPAKSAAAGVPEAAVPSAAAPDLRAAVPEAVPQGARKPLVPPGVLQGSAATAAETSQESVRRVSPVMEPEVASVPPRRRVEADEELASSGPGKALWAVVALGALLLVFLAYRYFSGSKASTPAGAPAAVSAPAAAVTPARAPVSGPASAETGITPTGPIVAAAPAVRAGAPGWHVVAFTYNHEGQAAEKVKRLRRSHNSLHPEVFTPTGGAPYYVALGGAMSQGQAEAVLHHARRSGLPRDTFVRRY